MSRLTWDSKQNGLLKKFPRLMKFGRSRMQFERLALQEPGFCTQPPRSHHTSTTFLQPKIRRFGSQFPGKTGKRTATNPTITKNPPQLTTKAQDLFYPQPNGLASAIDFGRSRNRPKRTRKRRTANRPEPKAFTQTKRPHPRKDGAFDNMPAIT